MQKYKLTNSSIVIDGITLYRIQALKDFGDVKKGDIGGYIQSEENLSQMDDCWVFDDAKVYGNAKVFDDVWGNEEVLISKPTETKILNDEEDKSI